MKYLFPLFQCHACKLAKTGACKAKCMNTMNKATLRLNLWQWGKYENKYSVITSSNAFRIFGNGVIVTLQSSSIVCKYFLLKIVATFKLFQGCFNELLRSCWFFLKKTKKKLIPLIFTTKFYKVHLIHEKWKRSTTKSIKLRRGLDIDGDMEKRRYCPQRESFISTSKLTPPFVF